MMFYSEQVSLISNQHAIIAHWNSCQSGLLDTPRGALFYAYHIPENATTALVISTGRIESAEKYRELLWELTQNGLAFFILDHQGQGRSYRHLADSHKGHVLDFSHYADDLALFVQQIVAPKWHGSKVLLGHSMGGAIAFDYLSRFPHDFAGLFLSAPMLGIETGGIPLWLTRLLARLAIGAGFADTYAPGQGPYVDKPFAENLLTHDEVRYQLFRQIYRENPELQLGGATWRWLNQALALTDRLPHHKVKIPLRIAVADEEKVVSNRRIEKVAARQENAEIRRFPGAYHELLAESDMVRRPVLEWLYEFCNELND